MPSLSFGENGKHPTVEMTPCGCPVDSQEAKDCCCFSGSSKGGCATPTKLEPVKAKASCCQAEKTVTKPSCCELLVEKSSCCEEPASKPKPESKTITFQWKAGQLVMKARCQGSKDAGGSPVSGMVGLEPNSNLAIQIEHDTGFCNPLALPTLESRQENPPAPPPKALARTIAFNRLLSQSGESLVL